jgi:CHASE2 domain-containing sensor protein
MTETQSFASEHLRGILVKTVAACVILFLVGPFARVEHLEQMAYDFGDSALSRLYKAPSADKITVVLVDDNSLKKLRQTWPLPWSSWEDRLTLVECGHPAAIFLDVLFKDKRGEHPPDKPPTCPMTMANMMPEVPVYFASVGDSADWAPFASPDRKLAIEWEGTPRAYPMLSTTTSEPRPTAAYALAKAICGGGKGSSARDQSCADTLSLEKMPANVVPRWPGHIPTQQADWNYSIDACRDATPVWWEVALALLLPPLHRSMEPLACPPFLTVNFHDLQPNNIDATFTHAIKGRVVLFGQNILGMHDYVPAPLHRQVPGVYLHAAVLENLMSLGHGVDRIELWPSIGFVATSVLVFYALASFAALWLGNMADHRLLLAVLGAVATYAALMAGMRLVLNWPAGMIPEAALMILSVIYLGTLFPDELLYRSVMWFLHPSQSPDNARQGDKR